MAEHACNTTLQYGHQRATIRLARAQGERCAHTRAWPLGAGSRYKIISWLRGGRPLCRDTVQLGAAIRRSAHYDTAQGRCDMRCSVRSWPWCWVCRDIGCDKAGQACDTAGHKLRHGPRHDCDTTDLGAVRGLCTQAGFKVCTWCTQPSFGLSVLFLSHCLKHCS